MKSELRAGDLVTCVKQNGWGSGAIYRIQSVNDHGVASLLCVFGAFPGRRKKNRRAGTRHCRLVTVERIREARRMLEALEAAELNKPHGAM